MDGLSEGLTGNGGSELSDMLALSSNRCFLSCSDELEKLLAMLNSAST